MKSIRLTISRHRIWRIAAASIAFGLACSVALAQFQGCNVDDYRCVEDLYFARCAERGSSERSCEELVAELQVQQRISPTTAIGQALGGALYRLADFARREGDEGVEAAYLATARQVFLDVVADDETARDAFAMLSILDEESNADSIAWLRKAVAVDPQWIYVDRLISLLFELGTAEAALEAIDVAERFFAHTGSWEDRRHGAADAYGANLEASRRFPEIVAPEAAEEVLDRLRQQIAWDTALRALEYPAREPDAVRDALETVCHFAGLLGDEPCLQGIEAASRIAIDDPNGPNAQVLADAAALGMMAYPRWTRMEDTWTTTFVPLLDQFVDQRLDSLTVLGGIARISRDRDRRREVRREIVSRNPNSGAARFELGKVYYDQRLWAEAVVELELARELSPPEDQMRIRSYLRQAQYEVGNND